MMGICCLSSYRGFSCRLFVTGSVLWTLCKHKKNPRFYILIRSLLRIHMHLNYFDKQVSLRMFSNLLANIFLAENFDLFSFAYVLMIEVLVCFVHNVSLYHFASFFFFFLYHSQEINPRGCIQLNMQKQKQKIGTTLMDNNRDFPSLKTIISFQKSKSVSTYLAFKEKLKSRKF